ncbi:hypothetical protein BDZ45DRAFT_13844 [Acephala macrosclerotiorum]|nr:hypothetical protein BDZ45DRAFT_13844 [Acephala macrosclerotiorum]
MSRCRTDYHMTSSTISATELRFSSQDGSIQAWAWKRALDESPRGRPSHVASIVPYTDTPSPNFAIASVRSRRTASRLRAFGDSDEDFKFESLLASRNRAEQFRSHNPCVAPYHCLQWCLLPSPAHAMHTAAQTRTAARSFAALLEKFRKTCCLAVSVSLHCLDILVQFLKE